jgi:hypothetical protein
MKKIISVLVFSIIMYACSSKKEGNMIVQGQIKGLKKGKLYLQKMVDTVLVSVDSIALLGTETFKLTDNVDSSVLYYLTFDGNTTDKRILFLVKKVQLQLMIKLTNLDLIQKLMVLTIRRF